MQFNYEVKNVENMISPSLVYYSDVIKKNTEEIISVAGCVERLWPHVKTHKSIQMVAFLMSRGIRKFKAATISEAEMCAMAGADKVILAYPLVGPNQKRLIHLAKAYPNTIFYGILDNYDEFEKTSTICEKELFSLNCLIDVNMGMNRTGVPISELEDLYRKASVLAGINLTGLHCYDGNHNNPDFNQRNNEVLSMDNEINEIINNLKKDGYTLDTVVAGGTPSFPCHAKDTEWYLSPGTSFIQDAGYYKRIPDLHCIPGAAIVTRVISHPAKGFFTLDLGYKGIASDPVGQRGYIVGYEDAEHVLQNEEHWVFQLKDYNRVPPIGSVLYVIPTHICPTSALYPEIFIAENNQIVNRWQVTSRNRKINY